MWQTLIGFGAYWYWLIGGVLLILAELAIPGFVVGFFGLAAVVVSGVMWLCPELPLTWALLIFAVLGLAMVFGCRKLFPKFFSGRESEIADSKVNADIDGDEVSGAVVTVLETIEVGKIGKVEFRGSQWQATADRTIAAGESAKILRRDNLTLILD